MNESYIYSLAISPKDYRHSYIFDTERSGVNPISTREILRALEIPQEIIDQIEFED